MKAKNKFATLTVLLIGAVLLLNSCAKDPEKAKTRYLALGQGYMKKGQFAAAAIEFQKCSSDRSTLRRRLLSIGPGRPGAARMERGIRLS